MINVIFQENLSSSLGKSNFDLLSVPSGVGSSFVRYTFKARVGLCILPKLNFNLDPDLEKAHSIMKLSITSPLQVYLKSKIEKGYGA